MRYYLSHGLQGSGADIEYEIIEKYQFGYKLKFFDDYFYLSKNNFDKKGVIKLQNMIYLREALKELICETKKILIKKM